MSQENGVKQEELYGKVFGDEALDSLLPDFKRGSVFSLYGPAHSAKSSVLVQIAHTALVLHKRNVYAVLEEAGSFMSKLRAYHYAYYYAKQGVSVPELTYRAIQEMTVPADVVKLEKVSFEDLLTNDDYGSMFSDAASVALWSDTGTLDQDAMRAYFDELNTAVLLFDHFIVRDLNKQKASESYTELMKFAQSSNVWTILTVQVPKHAFSPDARNDWGDFRMFRLEETEDAYGVGFQTQLVGERSTMLRVIYPARRSSGVMAVVERELDLSIPRILPGLPSWVDA